MLDTGLSFKEVYFTVMKPKNKVQLLIVKMFKDAGYFDKRRRTQKPEALD
jgi:hypothetical protein